MRALWPAIVILCVLWLDNATATTWTGPMPEPDPVRDGASCQVAKPMSSGSYIYGWPSKYDQVFWPLTDPKGIWFCEDSGFTAFIDDFALSAEEQQALAEHLPKVYQRGSDKPNLRQLLDLLQQSYARRTTKTEDRIRLLRVVAYYNDAQLQDYATATALRKQALELIGQALQTQLKDGDRYEYLFVTAAYHREFGEVAKSDAALQSLKSALQGNKNKELNGFVDYLTELSNEVARIAPGGPLAPEPLPRQR
jgi:hypothetical protein